MTVSELCHLQDELQFLLQRQGPVAFVRELVAQSGAQLLAHDTRTLAPHRHSTRFRFVDTQGAVALLTVITEFSPSGRGYALSCEPLRGAC
jgi:hypothetical protein